mmetsp:Transcript_12574/g.41215  ORF Transcript_12574/g.41215 Transcript_12574/m.41215 type:complete len:474 (+) Transcript_12574:1590-3011(+)
MGRSAGVAHAGSDALHGDDHRVVEVAVLGRLFRRRVVGAHAPHHLALHGVQRHQVGRASGERGLGGRLICEEARLARDLQEDVRGLFEPLAQLDAEGDEPLVGLAALGVIQARDTRIRLGDLELDQVDKRGEEGPSLVHLAQLGQAALLGRRRRDGLATAEPHWQVEPHLRPREDPRDRAERLDAALRLALGGARAEVHRGERRRRARRVEVLGEDAARRLVDGALESGGRLIGKALDECAVLGARQRRRRDGVLQHGDGVALQRVHRHTGRAEVRVDLLALHGDPVTARDGPRGLREESQVLRPAAAADGAAAAVEERDARVGLGRHLEQILLRGVQLPERGQLARVLGRVRIAEHHLVHAAVVVARRGEHAAHHGGRSQQVLARLEEGRHAHRRREPAGLLQQAHREDVRGLVGHRYDVGSERLRRQAGQRGEGVEHLAHRRGARQVNRQQWPLRAQLSLDPLAARLLIPR